MHEFIYNPYMATRIVEDQLRVVVPGAERESTHQSPEGAISNSVKRELWNSAAGGLRLGDASGGPSPRYFVPPVTAQDGIFSTFMDESVKNS